MTSPLVTGPTPEGVPVSTKSPVSRVKCSLIQLMRYGILKIISRVLLCCFTTPFTLSHSSVFCGSGIFSRGMKDPTGQDVSKPFAMDHGNPEITRALISVEGAQPSVLQFVMLGALFSFCLHGDRVSPGCDNNDHGSDSVTHVVRTTFTRAAQKQSLQNGHGAEGFVSNPSGTKPVHVQSGI